MIHQSSQQKVLIEKGQKDIEAFEKEILEIDEKIEAIRNDNKPIYEKIETLQIEEKQIRSEICPDETYANMLKSSCLDLAKIKAKSEEKERSKFDIKASLQHLEHCHKTLLAIKNKHLNEKEIKRKVSDKQAMLEVLDNQLKKHISNTEEQKASTALMEKDLTNLKSKLDSESEEDAILLKKQQENLELQYQADAVISVAMKEIQELDKNILEVEKTIKTVKSDI